MSTTASTTMASFFDSKASTWDDSQSETYEILQRVATFAGITKGSHVLDIGCGTGKMIQAYLNAGAEYIVGLDMSPKMIAQASAKFNGIKGIEFYVQDLLDYALQERFDAVVFYNVWPHIVRPAAAAKKCAELLKPNGRFVIAHGTSKEYINNRHANVPATITRELNAAEIEQIVWKDDFEIDTLIDDADLYCISGTLLKHA